MSYYKKSKTLDIDEEIENSNVKKEIKRILKKNIDCINDIENDTDIVSLNDFDNLSTNNTLNNFYKEDKKFIASAKSCFQIETNHNNSLKLSKNNNQCNQNDLLIMYCKDLKMNLPEKNTNGSATSLSKISIGINTSKEPSPINNINKNFGIPKPNFLETALSLHNKIMIDRMQPISFNNYHNEYYYAHSMPNIPLSYGNFSNSQVMNSANFISMGGNFYIFFRF